MQPGQIECPHCRAPVTVTAEMAADGGKGARCPCCSRRFVARLFPALFRADERGQAGEPLVDASQAACFFHAGRRATVACDECGRFLCALCDLTVGGRHLCPLCLQTPSPRRQAAAPPGQQTTVLYDGIALALAGFPMLLIWPTLLTAPAALFVVCHYWGRVKPPVPRWSRLRFILAALLALAQIGGWVALGAALIR